jgi:hypothetical protein
LKRVPHRIESKNKKNATISNNFKMFGIEFISEIIDSFRSLFLLIRRNGLRILSILSDFKYPMLYYEKTMLKMLAITMRKSSLFQLFFK